MEETARLCTITLNSQQFVKPSWLSKGPDSQDKPCESLRRIQTILQFKRQRYRLSLDCGDPSNKNIETADELLLMPDDGNNG